MGIFSVCSQTHSVHVLSSSSSVTTRNVLTSSGDIGPDRLTALSLERLKDESDDKRRPDGGRRSVGDRFVRIYKHSLHSCGFVVTREPAFRLHCAELFDFLI